jgi:hypothetical protein
MIGQPLPRPWSLSRKSPSAKISEFANSRLCFGRCCCGSRLLSVMVPLGFAARRVIAELRKPLVEVLERGFALFQKVGDETLLALFDRLFLRKEFFDIICFAFFRHKGMVSLNRQAAHGFSPERLPLSLRLANSLHWNDGTQTPCKPEGSRRAREGTYASGHEPLVGTAFTGTRSAPGGLECVHALPSLCLLDVSSQRKGSPATA